jgi:pSer/pThr/pTyr-binding forkhead associated (FHA) protein
MGYVVVVSAPDMELREVRLVAGDNLIGRDSASTLVLEGPGVSRRHAKLVLSGDRLTLIDLGSSYGTKVNDATALWWELAVSDVIQVGSNTLRLREVADPPTPTVSVSSTAEYVVAVSAPNSAPGELELIEGESLIGRDPSCALVLDGRGVSRIHAKLVLRAGRLTIVDLGSTYGTTVNNLRTMRWDLVAGDVVRVGRHTLTVRARGAIGSLPPAVDGPCPGATIGRYRLLRRVGEDEFAQIYAAEHLHVPQEVRIRLLKEDKLRCRDAVWIFHQQAESDPFTVEFVSEADRCYLVLADSSPLPVVEDARRAFAHARLPLPPIPEPLAGRLAKREDWHYSTRADLAYLYHVHFQLLGELAGGPVEDYVHFGHSGHGVNSYAMTYCLVSGALAIFLNLPLGGVYMDEEASTRYVADCFLAAHQLVRVVERAPDLRATVGEAGGVAEPPSSPSIARLGERLSPDHLIVCGDDQVFSSWWKLPGGNICEADYAVEALRAACARILGTGQ